MPLPALQAGYARRRLVRRGLPIRTDTYVVDDQLIWGATARILAEYRARHLPAAKRLVEESRGATDRAAAEIGRLLPVRSAKVRG